MVNTTNTQMQMFLHALSEKCQSKEDFEFISQMIKESEHEPGFYTTPYNFDGILYKRNPKLVNHFHSLSKQFNIPWSHTSPEDEDTYLY